jgi:hypothetical protein
MRIPSPSSRLGKILYAVAWLLGAPLLVFAAATIPAGCSTPGDCDELTPRFLNVTATTTVSGSTVHASNRITSSGSIKARLGATTQSIKVGGMLPGLPNVTPVGNIGAGEDDLMSYTVPANTMAANGDTIEFSGVLVDNGATSDVKFYFAGNEITGALNDFINGTVPFRVIITRLTSSSAVISVERWDAGAGIIPYAMTMTGLNFTTANIFKTTGAGGALTDNDIQQIKLAGWYYPAN